MATHISSFDTNFNNKMDCQAFIHIDVAPRHGLPESVLEKTVYEIRTKDASHAPVNAKLEDLIRLQLHEISDAFTWPSHGVRALDYFKMIINEKPEIRYDSLMAIYFFKKI